MSLYPQAISQVTIGRTLNAGYPLDVVGDINFSGTLRSNGTAFGGSSFVTNNNNVYLPSGSNLGIGKTTPACALDVVGSINASSNISIGGQSLTGLGTPNQVVYTSGTQTWSIPSGVTQVEVEMVGGGGGGGGGGTTNNGYYNGAGGGAGGYARFVVNTVTSGSLTITVGAYGAYGASGATGANGSTGGNTTVTGTGVSVTAYGGGGGNGGNNGTGAAYRVPPPGIGGSATATTSTAIVGNFVGISGGSGQTSGVDLAGAAAGSNGGTSYFGGCGIGVVQNQPSTATAISGDAPSNAYGGGGGGGRYSANGGNGAGGVVIITYFSASGLPAQYTATAPLSMSGTTLSLQNGSSFPLYNNSSFNAVSSISIPVNFTGTSYNLCEIKFRWIQSAVADVTVTAQDSANTTLTASECGFTLFTPTSSSTSYSSSALIAQGAEMYRIYHLCTFTVSRAVTIGVGVNPRNNYLGQISYGKSGVSTCSALADGHFDTLDTTTLKNIIFTPASGTITGTWTSINYY